MDFRFPHPPLPVLAGIILACVVLLVVLLAWMFRSGGGHSYDERAAWRDASQRWATRRRVRDLVVTDLPAVGRLWIGRFHNKIDLFAPLYHSLLVMAPSGSGKTSRLVVRNVLDFQGPSVVASVKADLYKLTHQARATLGTVNVFDLAGMMTSLAPGMHKVAWSPLLGIHSYQDAEKVAKSLSDSSKAGDPTGDVKGQRFWDAESGFLIAPLLWAAVCHGHSIRDVAGWVKEIETKDAQIQALIASSKDPRAMQDWLHFKSLSAKETKSSVAATAATVLAAWGRDEIRATVDIRQGHAQDGYELLDIDQLLDSDADTLYLVAPMDTQDEFTAVFETLVNEVLRRIQLKSHARGGLALTIPVFICIDEAANVAPLRNLDKIVTTMRGLGCVLLTVWQDMAQLVAMYGPHRAKVVLNNHLAQVYLPGATLDPDTLKMITNAVGVDTYQEVTVSTSKQGGSRSVSHREVEVAPEWWLRNLPQGEAISILSNHPAIRTRLPGYWEDSRLMAVIPADVTQAFANQYR